MNIPEILLLLSVALLNSFFIYIKVFLSKNGFKVSWIWEWGKDYYRFKEIAENEEDNALKHKYFMIINGLKFSVALLVFSGVLGVILS